MTPSRLPWARLLAAVWSVSLGTVGFLVVPLLFKYLPSPAVAGAMAAQLFAAQTWVSLACGVGLWLILGQKSPQGLQSRAMQALFLVAIGVLAAMAVQWGVAPRIVARDNLKLWHSLGTALYAVQWLSALVLFWRLAGDPPPTAPGPR